MSTDKKKIRTKFRDSVFKRDNHKCKFCSVTTDLDAHHITDRTLMPNGGYVKSNGITLCKLHHKYAERFHQSNGKDWESGFHPIDLYNAINSNYDIAYADSMRLQKQVD